MDTTNEMDKMMIAGIILSQLGGKRFIAMTGAKQFMYDEEGLQFRIGSNKAGANTVKVNYNCAQDTYTMIFLRWVPSKLYYVEVSRHEQIYCDMLQSTFTQVTGMVTSL